jgi:hypothetical protein
MCLAQTKRTTPPTEFQLSRSGQAEFVICDYTIEEMFGDMKRHGFDLESTHLGHFLRLSRLTLAVAILYVWLVAYGTRAIKNGKRHLVDRKDRRDLCVFQIGWRLVKRRLVNELPVSIWLCPNVW